MINRSALAASAALVIAMLAAAGWRIGILPAWVYEPDGAPVAPQNPWSFFIVPVCIALFTAIWPLVETRFVDTAVDQAKSWQRWVGGFVMVYAVFGALAQWLMIARSLGIAEPFSRQFADRAELAVLGCILIVFGDQMPKLPWLQPRSRRLSLDPVRGMKLLRFNGQHLVLVGLVSVVGALLLPLSWTVPLIVSIGAAGAVASLAWTFRLRREQMRERLEGGN
jgi:hypothetical protein